MSLIHNGRSAIPLKVTEKKYFLSGDWKCPGSPTGGHWWNCNLRPPVCKVCGKVKADEVAPP